KRCLADWYKNKPRCPYCTAPIPEMPTQIDQARADYILNCQMRCPHCNDSIQVRDYKMHFQKCSYLPLNCQCGEKIVRKEFLLSEKYCKCPKEECQYCCEMYYKRMVSFHSVICRNIFES